MEFNYKYAGSTTVSGTPGAVDMSFAPDALRQPTFFVGNLAKNIPFREAISALHDVVVSDLRFKPKDRTAYKEWAQQQEQIWLAEFMATQTTVAKRLQEVRDELHILSREQQNIMDPFYKARQKYFKYLYEKERDTWFVLDPVITVHPDEVFFECFSQDEASYGRLGCSYEVFKNISEFACGTTNIDYSAALYDEFQKIRDYKETQFTVDPSGFEVQTTNEDTYKEIKIDLPDSWVRGFLQVSSAMTLPAKQVHLHPMDVHNICFVLRRKKEKQGPRSMRYILRPGEPVRLIFEPWNIEVICHRSIYEGEADEIRVWGRRRLLILERLIPVAKKFTVHLLGTGLPSFYVADLGHMSFTLGLSGWTSNDWSRLGNFDLMAPRADVDDWTKQQVFNGLKDKWLETPDQLARRLGLSRTVVLGALASYTQAGRAIYDLNKNVYRVRELSREPLPMAKLRFANPREEAANQFVASNNVEVQAEGVMGKGLKLTGTVKENYQTHQTEVIIDSDERIAEAKCSCSFFFQNKLYKGPCEHILALRIAHKRKMNLN